MPSKGKDFSGKWKIVCWGCESDTILHNRIVLTTLKSWNNRPGEDALGKRVKELEAEVATMPKNANYHDVEKYYRDDQ